jgi:hypothetical protein
MKRLLLVLALAAVGCGDEAAPSLLPAGAVILDCRCSSTFPCRLDAEEPAGTYAGCESGAFRYVSCVPAAPSDGWCFLAVCD